MRNLPGLRGLRNRRGSECDVPVCPVEEGDGTMNPCENCDQNSDDCGCDPDVCREEMYVDYMDGSREAHE